MAWELGTFGVSMVVLALAVIGKHHFGPLDGVCNRVLELEPHQSTGAYANCGVDTFVYSVASFAFWAAIVIGAVSLAALAVAVVATWESAPPADSGTAAPSHTVSTTTVPPEQ